MKIINRIHARELITFVGIMLALLGCAHACSGCSANTPTPISIPPTPTTPGTDACPAGCKQKAIVCGDDQTLCTTACEDAVARNLATWVYQYQGPTCWAQATTPAAMRACLGVTQCGPSDAGAGQ
jgi:hypothetical protein